MELVQDFAGFLCLVFGPLSDRGTTANDRVLLFDFGSATAGDEWADVFLESTEGD